MSRMWHTSACRVQTNPVSGLGSLGGWTLGSTNVEGGLHSPFPVKLSLTRSPKLSNAMHIFTGTYTILVRSITSDYGQGMVQSSQFKISGLLQPCLVPKPHNHWRPILGLSKPNLSETIRTTLQQWEWVTSIDVKDAYFHIPIQEQSRTYQMSCPG